MLVHDNSPAPLSPIHLLGNPHGLVQFGFPLFYFPDEFVDAVPSQAPNPPFPISIHVLLFFGSIWIKPSSTVGVEWLHGHSID